MGGLPKAQDKFLDLEGKKIHYLEAGRGDPLVLIHGFLGSSNGFERIIPVLTKKFHVIVPDLPGYGFEYMSEELDEEHTIAAYTNFLSTLIKKLGHKKVGAVGLSMGGTVALEWTKKFPEEIKKLAVFEPVLEKKEISRVARILSRFAYRAKPLRRCFRWVIAQGAKREKAVKKLSENDQKAILCEIYGGSLRAAAESARDLLRGVDIKSYSKIQVPVLLLSGGFKTSISSPESVGKLAEVLSHVRVERFSFSSHNLVREEEGAPKFAQTLLQFFSS